SKQREAHEQRRQDKKLKDILHFLLSFLELDKDAASLLCNYPFFVGSTEEFRNERLKKRPLPARFWQMACPHAVLDDSLSNRRLHCLPQGEDQALKSKKMGKSRNLNRVRVSVH
ncbi:MAG TPA: hypothetical protein VF290_20260, partial [Pyrinomonadaceae bacterium]